ncbi:MAG: hypothetical protein J2P25_03555 [Nocardiopsaceae bacterium]|nr:hypothetical protein [Nocardiopsaceae bacterium]
MTGPWSAVPGTSAVPGGGVDVDVDVDGDFAQVAAGNRVGRDLIQQYYAIMRGQPATHLGSTEVALRMACYVPARNHGEVVRLLGLAHAVVLTGRLGSGRETTAIAAMRELRPGVRIRRFLLEKEDIEEIGHGNPCGYLIRVAEDTELSRLGGCADAVRDSGGYLAVIADRELTDPGAGSLPRVPVEPPQPLPVYRRWITEKHRLPEWAGWGRAGDLLEGALPAEAVRLADLIARVDRGGGSLEKRQAEVASAYLGWEEELRDWFGRNPRPHDRALLIAAATLPSGADEGYVYAAASSLARQLPMEVNGGGLGWWPVTGLRSLLETQSENGTIVFHRVGYAESALRHALTDYPLARTDLLTWLSELPTREAGEHGKANEVAETFAGLAAEHGAADHVTAAVRRWGQEGRAELAFIALSLTSTHQRVGGRVRRALYEWSRDAATPQTLKLTIAQVCELIGREYPSVALTRLKHLATRGDDQVRDEVIATSLALADAGHRRTVTASALDWCAETSEESETSEERLNPQERRRRRRAGATLFLHLASVIEPPGPGLPGPGLPAILAEAPGSGLLRFTRGWRAVLDFRPVTGTVFREATESMMCLWLDSARSHDGLADQVCALFVVAASPASPATGAAAWVASSASPGDAARTVIDIVQRWVALDRADVTRAEIERRIVIPLTSPWWRRLLRILSLNLRALRQARSAATASHRAGIHPVPPESFATEKPPTQSSV